MLKHFNLARATFWVLLIIPSYLLGWVYSVAFVSIVSIYANAASDFASWRADDNKELLEKLDSLSRKLDQIGKEVAQDK